MKQMATLQLANLGVIFHGIVTNDAERVALTTTFLILFKVWRLGGDRIHARH